jgi:hypothetical protein
MNVLALTIFVGAILVTLFVLLWLLQVMSPHGFSDRDALLPLEDETARLQPSAHKIATPLHHD